MDVCTAHKHMDMSPCYTHSSNRRTRSRKTNRKEPLTGRSVQWVRVMPREATNAQIQGWDQRQHCAISHHHSPLTTRHAAANVRTGVHEEAFLDNAIPKGSSLLLGKQQPAHIPGFWSLLSCPTKAPGHRGMRTRCALRLIESKKVVQRISCFLPSFKI